MIVGVCLTARKNMERVATKPHFATSLRNKNAIKFFFKHFLKPKNMAPKLGLVIISKCLFSCSNAVKARKRMSVLYVSLRC